MVTVSSSVADYRGSGAACASLALQATVMDAERSRFGRDDVEEANKDITKQDTGILLGLPVPTLGCTPPTISVLKHSPQ
jgi:hypothetical protein